MLKRMRSVLTRVHCQKFWFYLSRTVGLTMFAIILLANVQLPELMQRSDYLEAFYVAGHMVAHGHADILYPSTTINSFADAPFNKYAHEVLPYLDSADSKNHLIAIYMYSPLNAYLFAPLSLISPPWSLLVWQVLSTGGLACSCLLVSRLTGMRSADLFWMSMLFLPVFHTLLIGQLGIVFGILPVCLGYFLLTRSHPIWAGLIWSLMLLKPQFLPVVGITALALAFSGRAKCLLGLLSGVLGLSILNVMVLGPDTAAKWIHCLSLADKTYEFPSYLLICLPGAILEALPKASTAAAKPLVYVLSLLLALYGLRKSCRPIQLSRGGQSAIVQSLTVGSLLAPLVVPHLLFYDLTCLVPAGMLLLGCGSIRPSDKVYRMTVLTWIGINAYMLIFSLIGTRYAPPLVPALGLLSAYLVVLGSASRIDPDPTCN